MFNKEFIEVLQDKDDWLIRFCQKIRITKKCWLWTAAGGHHSQAVFNHDGMTTSAVRLAYNLANGIDPVQPIPSGKVLMHTCDNTLCVNPEHIKMGTDYDNQQDSIRKGRNHIGKPLIKLNYGLAQLIRKRYKRGSITQLELAKEHNVTLRNMQLLLANDIWKGPRK